MLNNPDKQKKPKMVKVTKALNLLMKIFPVEENDNELERQNQRDAEIFAWKEILHEMSGGV